MMLFFVFLYLLLTYSVIYFHEFGHFVAVKMCGLPVKSIQLGESAYILTFHLRNVQLDIGFLPIGGEVTISKDKVQEIQKKHFLWICVGGVLGNLVLFLVQIALFFMTKSSWLHWFIFSSIVLNGLVVYESWFSGIPQSDGEQFRNWKNELEKWNQV